MRRGRLAIGLLVAAQFSVLLVVVVGCGGKSDEEKYGEDFSKVARPLQAELIDLGNALGSSSRRGPIAAALGRADDALGTAASGFSDLDAPTDEIAAIQEQTVNAIVAYQGEVEKARKALADGNNRQASQAIGDFNAESQAFAAALGDLGQRLEDAGAELGEPATTGTA